MIDREVDVPLDCCPACGGGLSDVGVMEQLIEPFDFAPGVIELAP